MIEDLPSIKAATSTHCVSRAREGYARAPKTFAVDLPVQDAAILSSLRGCQTTLATGQHLIHRECFGAPQSVVDSAHAPAWARIPAVSASGCEASKDRIPTLERRSHQTVLADYATRIDGQWYRLSRIRKSRDYRPDDGLKGNLMIYKDFLIARKTVHPGLPRIHQYAISQNSI